MIRQTLARSARHRRAGRHRRWLCLPAEGSHHAQLRGHHACHRCRAIRRRGDTDRLFRHRAAVRPGRGQYQCDRRAQRTSAQTQGMDPEDPLFQFFKRFGPQFQMPQNNQPQLVRGLGSGFIISHDGLILTNAHVVDNAQEVTADRPARVQGQGPGFRRAVRHRGHPYRCQDLPTVKLGDASVVRVGEPVLAIGSLYGFENTATAGIVSAKSRSLPDDTYVPFIQTDVAVNPGNSGRPAVQPAWRGDRYQFADLQPDRRLQACPSPSRSTWRPRSSSSWSSMAR